MKYYNNLKIILLRNSLKIEFHIESTNILSNFLHIYIYIYYLSLLQYLELVIWL